MLFLRGRAAARRSGAGGGSCSSAFPASPARNRRGRAKVRGKGQHCHWQSAFPFLLFLPLAPPHFAPQKRRARQFLCNAAAGAGRGNRRGGVRGCFLGRRPSDSGAAGEENHVRAWQSVFMMRFLLDSTFARCCFRRPATTLGSTVATDGPIFTISPSGTRVFGESPAGKAGRISCAALSLSSSKSGSSVFNRVAVLLQPAGRCGPPFFCSRRRRRHFHFDGHVAFSQRCGLSVYC